MRNEMEMRKAPSKGNPHSGSHFYLSADIDGDKDDFRGRGWEWESNPRPRPVLLPSLLNCNGVLLKRNGSIIGKEIDFISNNYLPRE